jgi:hypothetical protein
VVPSTSGWLPPMKMPIVPSLGRNAGGLHQRIELADQLVALVEQVVRRMAAALLVADLLVGSAMREARLVDGAGTLALSSSCTLARRLDRLWYRAKTRSHLVGARQHHGARGQVGGRIGHVGEGVEHVDGRAQAGRAAGNRSSSFLSCSSRLLSAAAMAPVSATWRVSNSLWARMTVAASTPLP